MIESFSQIVMDNMNSKLIIFTISFQMLGLLAQSVETARNDSYFYSLMFMLLGVSVAIGFFFQVSIKFKCILMENHKFEIS